MCQGGQAWKRDQQSILDHAIDLGYDRIAPLPSLSADKKTWTSWADKFNAWKRSGMPMPKVEEPAEDGGGGFSRGLIETGDGLGPYPAYNKYFPMLTTAYEAPGFQDWSAYMTPGVFSGNGGALYQPWAGRDFSYTPPQFSVGPVQYYAPVSPLEIIFEEEMSEENNNSTGTNSEERGGGKGPGDVGYGASNPAYGYVDFDHFMDDMSNLAIGYDNLADMYGYDDSDDGPNYGAQTTGLGEPDNVSPSAEWGGGHTSSGAVSGSTGKGKGSLGGGSW